MTKIVIKKGIPFPENGFNKLPWDGLGIGDSFNHPSGKLNYAQSAANNRNKRHPKKKFKAGQLANGEVRIWRIE